MARKKPVQIFRYKCTITGDEYKLTKKASNPDDLVSINSYYELNPEKDDRPEDVKVKLGISTDEQD